MIQIILVFALLQLGYNLLFKPKYNQLACGLFGAAADNVDKINMNKIKILGIFNDVRGGHSCGIAIDGDTIKGTYKDKLFKDFITNHFIDTPERLPVVLGHTRMATGGAHTEENAHPFSFGENNDYDAMQIAHNGTLYNHIELAKKYDISTTEDIVYPSGTKGVRHKIDSEVLGEIIYSKGFDVLKEYEGAAALTIYNTRKPKSIFIYHGASKKAANDVELTEERPLFYYQESPGVFYYSSIKDSLEAINDTFGEIESFDCNYVYEIKNGDVSKAKKTPIDRSKAFQVRQFETTIKAKHVPTDYSNKEWDATLRKWVDKPKKEITTSSSMTVVKDDKDNTNLLVPHKNNFEQIHSAFIINNVYYENLRFFKNKNLLNGIYAVDKKCELMFISIYPGLMTEFINTNIKNGILHEDPTLIYFVNGVATPTMLDYNAIRDKFHTFTIQQISECSIYPVKGFAYDDLAYFRGKVADLTFTPLFGKSIIQLKNGMCMFINDRDKLPLDDCIKYLLPEDKEILEVSIAKEAKKVEEVSDEDTMIELYQDNLIATVEYCTDDTEASFDNIKTQSIVKGKLEEIKQFIIKTFSK